MFLFGSVSSGARHSPWVCSQSVYINIMDLMLLMSLVAVAAAAAVASATSAAHREDGAVHLSPNAIGNRYAITSIFPESGPTKGGTDVILTGNGIIDGENLACAFGTETNDDMHAVAGAISVARRTSCTEILCVAPEWGVPGDNVTLSLELNGMVIATSPLLFHYYETPIITSIYPTSGAALGGTRITLHGSVFLSRPGMLCRLGLVDVPAVWKGNNEVTCTSPPGTVSSTPLLLSFNLNGVDHSAPVMYRYIDLSIHSISPTFGHATGGTRVTFNLKEESPDFVSHCMFGSHIVPAIVLKLVCVSPPSLAHGPVHVGVSVHGEDFSLSELNFEYTKPAVFSTMRPTSGPESGGTVVALTGLNFVKSSTAGCYFGNVKVSGRWESDERLTCETPRLKPDAYKVRITLNGVDILDTHTSFFVYPRMTALFMLPSFGKALGGTSLAVYGTNFRSDDIIFCHFGGVSVNARYVGTNLVECFTPKWDVAEYVDLSVVTENGDTAIIDSPFAFYKPFHISSIHPTIGFFRGGTNVTVSGDHFSQSLGPVHCLFHHNAVNAVVVSESRISCTAPPAASRGDVEFALTYGSDKYTFHHQGFQYEEEIVLDAILPGVVPSHIGKLITVFGSMFRNTEDLMCMITNTSMTMKATFLSESQVLCRVPQGLQPGVYALSVSNNGQDFSESALGFSVIDLLPVKSIKPAVGSPDTVQVVSLEGSDFRDLESLGCLVGDKILVPSFFVNTTLIRCSIPPNLVGRGTVSLDLILDGVPISTGPRLLFTFYSPSAPPSGMLLVARE